MFHFFFCSFGLKSEWVDLFTICVGCSSANLDILDLLQGLFEGSPDQNMTNMTEYAGLGDWQTDSKFFGQLFIPSAYSIYTQETGQMT